MKWESSSNYFLLSSYFFSSVFFYYFFYIYFWSFSFIFFRGFPGSLTVNPSNDILGLDYVVGLDCVGLDYVGGYYTYLEVPILRLFSFCLLRSTKDLPFFKVDFLVWLVFVSLMGGSSTFLSYLLCVGFLSNGFEVSLVSSSDWLVFSGISGRSACTNLLYFCYLFFYETYLWKSFFF